MSGLHSEDIAIFAYIAERLRNELLLLDIRHI